MTDDSHVQHTWHLTHPDHGDATIDLWTDGYSVRVDGGPADGNALEGGRRDVDELLASYTAAGWRLVRDYPVNDPATGSGEAEAGQDLGSRPEVCPMCDGREFEFAANHVTDLREGEAWLCAGPSCAWGRYVTA